MNSLRQGYAFSCSRVPAGRHENSPALSVPGIMLATKIEQEARRRGDRRRGNEFSPTRIRVLVFSCSRVLVFSCSRVLASQRDAMKIARHFQCRE